jgi:hypothetical protein
LKFLKQTHVCNLSFILTKKFSKTIDSNKVLEISKIHFCLFLWAMIPWPVYKLTSFFFQLQNHKFEEIIDALNILDEIRDNFSLNPIRLMEFFCFVSAKCLSLPTINFLWFLGAMRNIPTGIEWHTWPIAKHWFIEEKQDK